MKKVIMPSEINELLAKRVNDEMVLTVNDGKKLINERTKDRFYSFAGAVLNNCTGWTKEGGFKKIVKTALTVGGIALIGLTNTAWIAAGASAYAIWKGHREKKLFKKFVISNTDEYTNQEKAILKRLSLSEFYNENINVSTPVARKFFEVRKSKEHTFDTMNEIIEMKRALIEDIKKEGTVVYSNVQKDIVNETVPAPKKADVEKVVDNVNEEKIDPTIREGNPKKQIVMPNLHADAPSNIEIVEPGTVNVRTSPKRSMRNG